MKCKQCGTELTGNGPYCDDVCRERHIRDTTPIASDPSTEDLAIASYEPLYAIGTLWRDSVGGVWKYVKVVFGYAAEVEICIYQWMAWNGSAALQEFTSSRARVSQPDRITMGKL